MIESWIQNFYWSRGKGRFEVALTFYDVALPMSFGIGRGAFSFHVLFFDFIYWRGDLRYMPADLY